MWGFGKKDTTTTASGVVTQPTPFVEPESALIARGGDHPDLAIAEREREEDQARARGFFARYRAGKFKRTEPAREIKPEEPQPGTGALQTQAPPVSGHPLPELRTEPEQPRREPPPPAPPVEAPPQPAPEPEPEPEETQGEPEAVAAAEPEPEPEGVELKQGLFARLRAGLSRTGSGLTEGLATLFMGKKAIDDELLEELETRLLLADVGVEATQRIIDGVTQTVKRKELKDDKALVQALHENMVAILEPCSQPLVIDEAKQPFVLLVVGVNGVGKTTTIGKLARRFQGEGRSVVLAAGDTFRAAAVEQLKVWGERSKIPVIAQHTGADSASVIFDALQAAKSRGQQVMIADTAGRLHTQGNLMEELKKVKRVLGKLDGEAPHETLLVLDASNGQNALSQAKHFHEAVGVDGVVLTKLDGTAKGGVIFAIAEQLKLPIRFIGIGEKLEDLRPFDADEFVKALLSEPEE